MVNGIPRRIGARIKRIVEGVGARLRVRTATRHKSGTRTIRLEVDDVALVCMLKNGSYFLDGLLDHHRRLGIKHFLFIDNGSDDDTRERLADEPNVTVVMNRLPVGRYESLLRSQIAKRIIKGGWFLFVDSDELCDMINGSGRTIQDYARYCNEFGYDAIVGQALDLFSSRPLSETKDWAYEEAISRFTLMSLNSIETFDYHDENISFSWFLRKNQASNTDINFKFGGIRKELFDENCCLTVHRMVKNAPHIELYTHPHCSSNIHCADFSMLLRHYKFAGQYLARELRQAHENTWKHDEGRSRLDGIDDLSFAFSGQHVQRFEGAAKLVEKGFLSASPVFLSRFPPQFLSEQQK